MGDEPGFVSQTNLRNARLLVFSSVAASSVRLYLWAVDRPQPGAGQFGDLGDRVAVVNVVATILCAVAIFKSPSWGWCVCFVLCFISGIAVLVGCR